MKEIADLGYLPSGVAENKTINGCLVLEGGAFRGVHQEGVLDAFMNLGINLEAVVGTSAGALNGYNYICGAIGRSGYLNLRFRDDKRYVGLRNYIKNGSVIGFPFMFYSTGIPINDIRALDDRRKFVAVATNCKTGEAEYLNKDNCSNIYKAMQASSSVPYISKMVELDGNMYVDGGCADRIPYKWALENNYEKIIIIRSHPREFREKKCSLIRRANEYFFYSNYPELASKIVNRYEYYNDQLDVIDRLEKEGRVFVIAPEGKEEVKSLTKDIKKLEEFYFKGLTDGYKLNKKLKEYLEVS